MSHIALLALAFNTVVFSTTLAPDAAVASSLDIGMSPRNASGGSGDPIPWCDGPCERTNIIDKIKTAGTINFDCTLFGGGRYTVDEFQCHRYRCQNGFYWKYVDVEEHFWCKWNPEDNSCPGSSCNDPIPN